MTLDQSDTALVRVSSHRARHALSGLAGTAMRHERSGRRAAEAVYRINRDALPRALAIRGVSEVKSDVRRRPKDQMTRAQEAAWQKAFCATVTSYEGIPVEEESLAFRLDTPHGPLLLSIWNDTGYPTIFDRFEDTERARPFLLAHDGNDYTGKWNHHVSIMPIGLMVAKLTRVILTAKGK